MDSTDKEGNAHVPGTDSADISKLASQSREIEALKAQLAETESALREASKKLALMTDRLERRERQSDLFIRKMLNGFTVNRLILDDSGQPVDLEMLEVNDAFLKSTKLRREEIIGVPVSSYIPEIKSGGARLLQSAAAVALNNESFVGEFYFEKFGKWFEISAYSIQHGYFNVVFKDATRRRLAEKELEASKAFLECSLNSAPDAVLLMGADLRFTHVNPAFASIFGIPEASLIGKTLLELAPAFITDREAAWLQRGTTRLIESGKPVNGVEIEIKNPAGVIIPIAFSASRILDGRQRLLGVISFVKNITERKRAQELMIQTEKMMSVGGLAAGMAHEINNPLGGMLQGAQNILRRLSPELDANRRDARESGLDLDRLNVYIKRRKIDEMLEGIITSGKRAAQIISSMLQFSRQSESNLCPNDINALIDEVLDLCANDYDLSKKHDFRKIEIVKHYQEKLPHVPCTKTEIEQVLLNLLKNAAHAMAQTASLRPPRIVIRTIADERFVRIEVEDNGPGLEAADKKRVFEPFFTTKPVGKGTGLGLSVSYMIITNNHKGSMEVISEAGQGACFIVSLPLRNKAVSQSDSSTDG